MRIKSIRAVDAQLPETGSAGALKAGALKTNYKTVRRSSWVESDPSPTR